ncbi:MAG: argininosuccinate synthase, partial [Chloroflexota bacterium]|nr:argininosuccinate synthase [Chloroflexota bacterium]
QTRVNGTITLELYKGNIRITDRASADSLYHPEIRTLQSKSFDQRLCGPAAVIRSLPYKILAQHGLGAEHTRGSVSVGAEPMLQLPLQMEIAVQD